MSPARRPLGTRLRGYDDKEGGYDGVWNAGAVREPLLQILRLSVSARSLPSTSSGRAGRDYVTAYDGGRFGILRCAQNDRGAAICACDDDGV